MHTMFFKRQQNLVLKTSNQTCLKLQYTNQFSRYTNLRLKRCCLVSDSFSQILMFIIILNGDKLYSLHIFMPTPKFNLNIKSVAFRFNIIFQVLTSSNIDFEHLTKSKKKIYHLIPIPVSEVRQSLTLGLMYPIKTHKT